MKKVAKNFIFQLIYQFTQIFLPIITIPIVSHALGAEGLGLYNYVTSIVTYFILFAGLGLANYGIREIASQNRTNGDLSRTFWELELFNIIVVSIIILAYSIFLIFIPSKKYFLISGITLLATLFDISWFFYGIEEFEKITITNIIIKSISFVFIYVFIKESTDLPIYFLIQSISVLLSNLVLWIFIKDKVSIVKVKLRDVFKHLKPAMGFFLGKISIVLYTTLNKTLLGLLGSILAVGVYTNSLQIIIIIVTLIGTIDTVLMPHMTRLVSEKNTKQMLNIMEKTIDIQFFFSIPMFFGLLLINEKMVPWFFGPSFSKLNSTVPALAPLILIIPFGTAIARQYLLPMNQIRNYNNSVIYAAVVGIVTNLMLIPIVGIWGAICANILSELTVTVYRYLYLRNKTKFKLPILAMLKYLLGAIIMYIVTLNITKGLPSSIFTTVIQIIIGTVVYMIITYILKCNRIINIFLEKEIY